VTAGGLALLIAGVLAGCGGPLGPGEVPEELEGTLLTLEEAGKGFVEEYRGTMPFDVAGQLCPEGREAAGDALDVLSSDSRSAGAGFVSPAPPEYTGGDPGDRFLQHSVLIADAAQIADGMAALRAGFEVCYGKTWRVEGDEYTVEPLEVPGVGEESFGVLRSHFAEIPTAFLRRGETFMIVSVEEVPDPGNPPKTTEQEFARLVEAAADHLPS
jgi:hypothetical protein